MFSFTHRWLALVISTGILGCALMALVEAQGAEEGAAQPPRTLEGKLADGALWRATIPSRWNGTLLLYSHGYSAALRAPELAPKGTEQWLTAHGYALAATSYAKPGWAVAEAVPDQRELLTVFKEQVARPARTFAWGDSMGGLVTVALAESPDVPIDGAVSACGSIVGTVAMMNTALDGAYAFVTLQAPDEAIRLAGVDDDRANATRVNGAVTRAMSTPAGRARIALAGVLGALPGWTEAGSQRTVDHDEEALQQMANDLGAGLFPPRTDQERRAGGPVSWNRGVDYRRLLRQTGRWNWVQRFYRKANLSLEQDLRRLAVAPRLSAQPRAVQYMRQHYAPTALPTVPLFSLHTIGDGLTSPAFQAAYQQAEVQVDTADRFRLAFVKAAGHCTFSAAEYVAALETVESRVKEGHWSASPERLNVRAAALNLGPARFLPYQTPPLPRTCWARSSRCDGEPSAP